MSILNLQKNDILNLTKHNPGLENLLLAAGWDVVDQYIERIETRKVGGFFGFGGKTEQVVIRERNNRAQNIDLDLSVLVLNNLGKIIDIIYFGNKTGFGLRLHGDNLTGEGHGDDEKVSMILSKVPQECSKLIVAITIYQGEERKQNFGQIKNAYVRLVDEDNNTEICRYNLTEDGGENTCLELAQLEKINGEWNFKALGNLRKGGLADLKTIYSR